MSLAKSVGGSNEVGETDATDSRFLRKQTAGSILRNSFAIYAKNWRTFLAIYALPLVPIALSHDLLIAIDFKVLAAFVGLLQFVVATLLGVAVTILISDLCLGFQPSTERCYRRGFVNIGRLIGTYTLAGLIIIGGFILILIPGFVFSLWYMFIITVVVLEQKGGRAALRRSRELGKGFYGRNAGIVVLVTVLCLLVSLLFLALPWLLLGLSGFEQGGAFSSIGVCIFDCGVDLFSILLVTPLVSIVGILLYYDMRVRKDGYGATQLAEELRV